MHRQNASSDGRIAMGFDQCLFQPIQLLVIDTFSVLDAPLQVKTLFLECFQLIQKFVAIWFIQSAGCQVFIETRLTLTKALELLAQLSTVA